MSGSCRKRRIIIFSIFIIIIEISNIFNGGIFIKLGGEDLVIIVFSNFICWMLGDQDDPEVGSVTDLLLRMLRCVRGPHTILGRVRPGSIDTSGDSFQTSLTA